MPTAGWDLLRVAGPAKGFIMTIPTLYANDLRIVLLNIFILINKLHLFEKKDQQEDILC